MGDMQLILTQCAHFDRYKIVMVGDGGSVYIHMHKHIQQEADCIDD